MTRSDADIKALCDAATPGPWEEGDGWVYTSPVYEDDNRLSSVLGMKFADPDRAMAEATRVQPNVEFIAAARELVPSLLARAQQAEAERDEALTEYRHAIERGDVAVQAKNRKINRLRAELAEYREAVVVANKAWANEAAKVQAVEALHQPVPFTRSVPVFDEFDSPWQHGIECKTCRNRHWPCDTAKALAAVSSEPEDGGQ